MIGDDLDMDIKGAINVGMKVIYLNKEERHSRDYITINNLSKLKEIL